jgi:hypothetical protein
MRGKQNSDSQQIEFHHSIFSDAESYDYEKYSLYGSIQTTINRYRAYPLIPLVACSSCGNLHYADYFSR